MAKKKEIQIMTLEESVESDIDYIEIAYTRSYEECERIYEKLIDYLACICIKYNNNSFSLAIVYTLNLRVNI